MKKSLLFAALLLGVGFACKKSSSSNTSIHLTATIDGKNETFNVSPVATRTSIGGGTYIAIGGLATSSPTGELFQIGLSTNPGGPALKVGTYMDTTTQYTVDAIYQVSPTVSYTAGSV